MKTIIEKAEEIRIKRCERLDAMLAQAVSLMSASKWRRLIQAATDTGLSFPVSEWGILRAKGFVLRMNMPRPDDCLPNGLGIDEITAFGPFLFRDVHFVRWPKLFEIKGEKRAPRPHFQEISVLHDSLVRAGEYELTFNDSELILWAYRFPIQSLEEMKTWVCDASDSYCPMLGL